MANYEFSSICLKDIGSLLKEAGAVKETDVVNRFNEIEHCTCIIYPECDSEDWENYIESLNAARVKNGSPILDKAKISKYPVHLTDNEMSWHCKWIGTDNPAYYASKVIKDKLLVVEEFYECEYDGYYAFLNGKEIRISPLNKEDAPKVKELDEKSGFGLFQWINDLDEEEISDYGYGVFIYENKNAKGQLIGYCSLGYADDCDEDIENHPLHTSNSLLLSDVYILPEFRNKGIGKHLVGKAILMKNTNEAVFCCPMYKNLDHFYEEVGFERISVHSMVKVTN